MRVMYNIQIIIHGAITELEGSRNIDGRGVMEEQEVLIGAVSTEGTEHLQSEGATELLTDRVSNRAPLSTVSPPVEDEVGNTGTAVYTRQVYLITADRWVLTPK